MNALTSKTKIMKLNWEKLLIYLGFFFFLLTFPKADYPHSELSSLGNLLICEDVAGEVWVFFFIKRI